MGLMPASCSGRYWRSTEGALLTELLVPSRWPAVVNKSGYAPRPSLLRLLVTPLGGVTQIPNVAIRAGNTIPSRVAPLTIHRIGSGTRGTQPDNGPASQGNLRTRRCHGLPSVCGSQWRALIRPRCDEVSGSMYPVQHPPTDAWPRAVRAWDRCAVRSRCHRFAEQELERWYRCEASEDDDTDLSPDWDSYYQMIETPAMTPSFAMPRQPPDRTSVSSRRSGHCCHEETRMRFLTPILLLASVVALSGCIVESHDRPPPPRAEHEHEHGPPPGYEHAPPPPGYDRGPPSADYGRRPPSY